MAFRAGLVQGASVLAALPTSQSRRARRPTGPGRMMAKVAGVSLTSIQRIYRVHGWFCLLRCFVDAI
jgi:hypothetical protein